VRFKFIFFKRTPNGVEVCSLNYVHLDHLVGQEPDGPARMTFRWLRTGQRDQLRLRLAVENALDGRMGALLAGKHRIQPFHHEGLAHAGDRRRRCLQTLADCAIRPAIAVRSLVGFHKDARLGVGARGQCLLLDHRKQRLALIQSQLNYLFDVCQELFPGARIGNRESEHKANSNDAN